MLVDARVVNGRNVYKVHCENKAGEYQGYVLASGRSSAEVISSILAMPEDKFPYYVVSVERNGRRGEEIPMPYEHTQWDTDQKLLFSLVLTEEEKQGKEPVVVDGYDYYLGDSL